jgi:DNA-binding FadR family transcriptional regulator
MTYDIPLHDAVLDHWGMSIVSGAYAPGDRVSMDDEITGQQASRTVSREAMRVLESMGLVNVRRKVGATVNPPEKWHAYDPLLIAWRLRGPDRPMQLHALSELRAAVEPAAAKLAAAHATAEQLARLTEAAIGMVAHSRAANEADYLNSDVQFHRTLLEASGNVMFAALSEVVAAVLIGRTEHDLMPATANPRAVSLHAEVAVRIQAGDPEGAQAAMREIVSEADEAVQTLVG